jgi:translocation and assembly module TamB
VLALNKWLNVLKQKAWQGMRACLVLSMCLSFAITPQIVLAANLLVYSNLSEFEMDLGNAILRVDRIDSNLALSLNTSGELTISRFHAKHAKLTFKPTTSISVTSSDDSANRALPERIDLPLPIALEQGLIDELVIEQANETQIMKAITFNLHANDQSLRLALNVAESPWGQLQTEVDMENKKPFALNGILLAEQANASTPYSLKAELSGDLAQLHLHALHHYQPESSPFMIVPASPSQQSNLIALDAEVSLQDQMPASLQIQIKALNTAHIHPQLEGQLNVSLDANGALSGQQPMQVVVESNNSHVNQHPLVLNAQATLVDFVLTNLDLSAQLATNQFKLSGGLNPNDSNQNTLRWAADLPALDEVMDGFSGTVKANGEIVHLANSYEYQYQLEGDQLSLPNQIHTQQISAKGRLSTVETAPLETNIAILGLINGDLDDIDNKPINATFALSGSLAQHQLAIAIANTNTNDKSFGLNSVVEGKLDGADWQGAIRSLVSQDEKTLRLTRPAPMTFSPSAGFSLSDLLLQVREGQIQIDTFSYQPAGTVVAGTRLTKATLNTQGRLQQLPVQVMQEYLGLSSTHVENNLTLDGAWRINLAEQVNADISITRAGGDVILHDVIQQSKQAMGLNALALKITAVNNQLSAETNLRSDYAGTLQANLSTTITSTPKGYVLSEQAPLSLHAEANLQHLNWLTSHDADTNIDGALSLVLDANGTIATPALTGYMRGSALSVLIPSQGIELSNGKLDAMFSEQTFTVKQLDFAGKTGTLKAQGQANLIQRPVQLDLKVQADRLTALSRTDRLIVLSGDGDMIFNGERALINGQFKVHRGLFELPKAGRPTLDDDVIILGKQNQQSQTKLGISLGSLTIDFGNKPTMPFDESRQFMLRGQGLNGALSGLVRLSGSPPQIEAFGTLEVNGTYLAYGQLLNIETGQINLSGPITNAGLNIVAMRNLQPTKVGVKLSGDVKTPQLKLISEPETTNDDKLSLLVLGRPMSEAGNSELAMLSVAAGALLSQGDSVPLQSRIANLAGFDSLDIQGTSDTDYSVNVGKRINRQLTIGYEKSIFGLLNVAKLTYQLTRRIAIETKAGSENALDVVYSFSFD